ncbi:MAG: type I 3-dehydroquinate dehydratase [Promethearchaeota archaeon]
MKSSICISIPIKSNDLREAQILVNKALTFNPLAIEFRFDYIKKKDYITKGYAIKLKDLLENKCISIFTLRDKLEGGKLKIQKLERIELIKMLIQARPDFFDVELNTDLETLNNVISLSFMEKVNLIFSYHNLKETLNYETLKNIILNFEEKIIKNKLNEFDILSKSIYKLIFTAQNIEDNLVPLKLCQEFSRNKKRIISFCMDKLGIISRIMCVKLGSFLTYAALEEQTAPGQIYVKIMQQFYELF